MGTSDGQGRINPAKAATPARPSPAEGAASRRGQWLVLAAALLGWLFDGAEQGVFSLVGRPSLLDLLGSADRVGTWFGAVTAGFLVGAATGGVLFGWLGDRIGRVRAMTLSVLTYALFTGLCGLSQAPVQLAVLRFVAALGMGGEWALGVALVMEVWPNRSRAVTAGLIGAAANVGYLLVGAVSLALLPHLAAVGRALSAVGLPEGWVEALMRHQGWRLMMLLGTAPALLTFFFRLFVPESERWQQQRRHGATTGWATRDLLAVLVGVLGPALIIYLWATDETRMGERVIRHGLGPRLAGTALGLAVALAGYTFPVIRYLQRTGAAAGDDGGAWRRVVGRMVLAAGLAGVALLGTWGSAQWVPSWADRLTEGAQRAKEHAQIWLAVGAIVGTLLAALAGDWFGRRLSYCLLCLGSLGSVWLLFQANHDYGPLFLPAAFLLGLFTASFYGWLPLYLPELFPTKMRATGQGFSYNFGRILAAIGALQTGNLMGLFRNDVEFLGRTWQGGYPLACSVMGLIYVGGAALIWLAPETRGRPLPE